MAEQGTPDREETVGTKHAPAPPTGRPRTATLKTVADLLGALSSLGALVGLFFIYDTLKATKESTEDANRAWIDVENPDFSKIYTSQSPVVTVDLVNLGREPAQAIQANFLADSAEISTGQWVTEFKVQPFDPCAGETMSPKGILFTDKPIRQIVDLSKTRSISEQGKIKTVVIAGLKSDKSVMYIFGCVTYVTYGIIRHTRYCYYVEDDLASQTFVTRRCPSGNSAD